MKKISNTIKENFYLIIVVLIFLLIAPIGYYFLYALPKLNNDKIEFEKQKFEQEQINIKENKRKSEEEKTKQEEEKNNQKELLNTCLFQSQLKYSDLWNNECKAWKIEVNKAWENCRSKMYSWQTDETNKEDCKSITPDYSLDEDGVCLLPGIRSSRVEADIKEMKDECYKKYPVSN